MIRFQIDKSGDGIWGSTLVVVLHAKGELAVGVIYRLGGEGVDGQATVQLAGGIEGIGVVCLDPADRACELSARKTRGREPGTWGALAFTQEVAFQIGPGEVG